MQTDLEVIIYEKKMNADLFVNTHYTDTQMTSVLVVVPKKKTDEFMGNYEELLLNFNKNDLANWTKRTKATINMAHQNVDDEVAAAEIIESEIQTAIKAHELEIRMPGVIPGSAKFLGQNDDEGNQLYRITTLQKQTIDFIRLLKKSGFQAQRFDYDVAQYMENQALEAKLKLDLNTATI